MTSFHDQPVLRAPAAARLTRRQDTSSAPGSGAGIGLALTKAGPKVTALAAGPAALREYLSREFDAAEATDPCDPMGGVSAVMAVDLGTVRRQHAKWTAAMPRVRPFYAVKANPDPMILKTLGQLGAGFDCASASEIHAVAQSGADLPEDIIFANCCKFPNDVRYAASKGVRRTTFDNADELHKIKQLHPDAELLLRIVTDDSTSVCRLSNKYGAALHSVPELLELAAQLELNVVGISFHVGSGTNDPKAFAEPLRNCAAAFATAKQLGMELRVLDIGGGFPGDDEGEITFDEIASVVNPLLDELFEPAVEVIAEPGRFFAHASASLATKVIARRVVSTPAAAGPNEEADPDVLYYLGDGVYGSFNCILFDHYNPPLPDCGPAAGEQLLRSRLFGPTCDGLDTIAEAVELPLLPVGQLLVFRHMGAYTIAAASNFNGIRKPNVVYVSTA